VIQEFIVPQSHLGLLCEDGAFAKAQSEESDS
jgi:hypothetical protein